MATEKYVCTLTEAEMEVAAEQLHEDASTRAIEVKTLRERLEKYPGLHARTDPRFLLRFLRAKKFDQEAAYQLVINYYKARRDEGEIFNDLKPSRVKHVFESGYCTALGITDKHGATVVLDKPGSWDIDRFSELDLIKADVLTIEKLIAEERTQVYGFCLLVDYSGFGLSHLARTPPSFAMRLCHLWQDVFPARLKAVHIVNEPSSFGSIFGLFKPFLKQKLLSRIKFHGSKYSTLHEDIDPALLPEAYGGTGPDITSATWTDVILGCDKHFESDTKFGLVDMNMGGGNGAEQGGKGGVATESLVGTFKKLET